ncbi:hypothetical protein HYV73_02495 [Candidatus Uhrbacteria bacterium]|nr:hypothetical protein [Candidatus Uhrbacteria bacterium]
MPKGSPEGGRNPAEDQEKTPSVPEGEFEHEGAGGFMLKDELGAGGLAKIEALKAELDAEMPPADRSAPRPEATAIIQRPERATTPDYSTMDKRQLEERRTELSAILESLGNSLPKDVTYPASKKHSPTERASMKQYQRIASELMKINDIIATIDKEADEIERDLATENEPTTPLNLREENPGLWKSFKGLFKGGR